MLKNALILAALSSTMGLLGCDLADKISGVTETEYINEGTLCWGDEGLTVDFNLCLSSSCDTLAESYCTTSYADNTLTVESYARVESMNGTCTADCGMPTATCTDMPLIEDSSTVTVSYGDAEMPLDDLSECGWY